MYLLSLYKLYIVRFMTDLSNSIFKTVPGEINKVTWTFEICRDIIGICVYVYNLEKFIPAQTRRNSFYNDILF